MDYVPHTAADREEMLRTIGVSSLAELFRDIPPELCLRHPLALPPALSEQELSALLTDLASRNNTAAISLMGAGLYRHYIPAVVRHIAARSEFTTAYTPYQAEISQGILQAMFEYQTMIAELTGMDVANASLYDGATAMAEAALLSVRSRERHRVLVTRSVHPHYRQVLATYAWVNGWELTEIPFGPDGRVDQVSLEEALTAETACLLVQSPNFFGVVEDLTVAASVVHRHGALLVAGFTEATSLGLLAPPGSLGADLVAGEGQAFGNELNYGGPCLGILAAREEFVRRLPGRLVGQTVDQAGQRGFVLTIQTREQHIRREKATSNICTNEALCSLAAAVYLVCLGRNLHELARLNLTKAAYLRAQLVQLPGWRPVFSGPVYNEFVLACPSAEAANRCWQQVGILGGYPLGRDYPQLDNCLLLCATEMLSRQDMDRAVAAVADRQTGC